MHAYIIRNTRIEIKKHHRANRQWGQIFVQSKNNFYVTSQAMSFTVKLDTLNYGSLDRDLVSQLQRGFACPPEKRMTLSIVLLRTDSLEAVAGSCCWRRDPCQWLFVSYCIAVRAKQRCSSDS